MQTVSSDFLNLVKGSTRPIYTADVWYNGELVFEDVRIIDSKVSFDASRAVRGTLDIAIADPDNVMVPTALSSPLAPFGGIINVRAGFTWNNQSETVSLGWFDIQDVEVEEAYKSYTVDGAIRRVPAGSVIRVSAADFMQRVVDYPFLTPDIAITNSGTNLVTNPGLQVDDSGWSFNYGTSGSGSNTRITKQAFDGGVSGRMTWTNVSTNSATGSVTYAQTGLSAATAYTFSVMVRSNKARTFTPQIVWLTAAGATISTTSGTAVTLKANRWTKLVVSGTAPATTAQASLVAAKTVADMWEKSDTLDFDNAVLVASSAPRSWTVWDEIKRLVGDVVGFFEPDFDTPEVPAGIVYDKSRFDAIASLAKLANAEPVVTADGQLTLELLTAGDLAPDIDYKVNLTGYKRSISRKDAFNIVVVSGKGANSLTIRRTASTTSGALTVDGAFGRRPTFYDSDLLTTVQAVQSKADDLLSDVATARNQSLPVTMLPNPALELNDFVNLITERGNIQGRITAFEYPSVGDMSLTVAIPNFWWA